MTEQPTSRPSGPDGATTAGADLLALAAVEPVQSGMLVGLGTGRTANRAVRALVARVRDEKLDIDCVSSSVATENLARELGLPTVPSNDIEVLDYSFDGADEVDHKLRMLKGGHGAITRQRLVAAASRRCVFLATEEKLVDHLGAKALLVVTIIPFAVSSIRNRLRDMGLSGVVRRGMDGEVFISDGGGMLLDMRIPENCDIEELALRLDHIAGVVDHGIFLTEADEVLIECRNGEIRRLLPPEQ